MSNLTPAQYRRRSALVIDLEKEPSLTEQAHKRTCDIHTIMRKYEKTGIIEHTAQYQGTYGDFANAPEFDEAQRIIADAKSMFETVPAKIRERFNNDPGEYVSFMTDDANYDAIAELGLDNSHLTEPERPPKVETPPEEPTEPPAAA